MLLLRALSCGGWLIFAAGYKKYPDDQNYAKWLHEIIYE
jgi:hypothetical protein